MDRNVLTRHLLRDTRNNKYTQIIVKTIKKRTRRAATRQVLKSKPTSSTFYDGITIHNYSTSCQFCQERRNFFIWHQRQQNFRRAITVPWAQYIQTANGFAALLRRTNPARLAVRRKSGSERAKKKSKSSRLRGLPNCISKPTAPRFRLQPSLNMIHTAATTSRSL